MSDFIFEVENKRFNDHDYKIGWVLPDGRFYGCDWAHHELVIIHHFHKEVADVEKEGWTRLCKSQPFTQFVKTPNKKQIRTIIDKYSEEGSTYALKLFLEKIK